MEMADEEERIVWIIEAYKKGKEDGLKNHKLSELECLDRRIVHYSAYEIGFYEQYSAQP